MEVMTLKDGVYDGEKLTYLPDGRIEYRTLYKDGKIKHEDVNELQVIGEAGDGSDYIKSHRRCIHGRRHEEIRSSAGRA